MTAQNKPNILLLLADDIGVDALRVDEATREVTVMLDSSEGEQIGTRALPNITKLFQNGIHFTRAWAQPVCSPTRASLFTGLQPWRTGVGYPAPGGNSTLQENITGTNNPIVTLAESLKTEDYHSAMFGKWHLGHHGEGAAAQDAKLTPTERGWDHFEGVYRGGLRPVGNDYGVSQRGPVVVSDLEQPINQVPPNLEDKLSLPELRAKREAAAAKCKAYLKEVCPDLVAGDQYDNQRDIRYFIWDKAYEDLPTETVIEESGPGDRTHMYATRDQIYSAMNWIRQMLGRSWCISLTLIVPHDPFHIPPEESFSIQFKDKTKPTVTEMFVAMVESMDFYIGKLLNSDDPEIRHQLANTVIIFAGDNGTQDRDSDSDAVLDRDLEDKATYHIGGVHVPMCIADGGTMLGSSPCYIAGPLPRLCADPVHIVDLYRTMTDIADAQLGPSAAMDSISLEPHLKQTNGAKRTHYFSQQYPSPAKRNGQSLSKFATVSDGSFKLTCNRTSLVDGTNDEYQYEFCELSPDPRVPGALKESEPITNFLQSPHRAKVDELYRELTKNFLDAGQTQPQGNEIGTIPTRDNPLKFPPLSESPVTITGSKTTDPPLQRPNPELIQFAADPRSGRYIHGGHQAPNWKITGAPPDADLARWALVHDDRFYRMCCFKHGRDDQLCCFAFNGSAYAYGQGGYTELGVTGFPADTDTRCFAMAHDGRVWHLFMRRKNAPLFYRAALVGNRFVYGAGDYRYPDQIGVSRFPSNADWDRWTMLHDNHFFLLAVLPRGNNTTVYQGALNPRWKVFMGTGPGWIANAPSNCDFGSFSMLHDNSAYRLYFQNT
ncbi:MAG: sulfatase-like hydrolase/transferase [Myxococcota bacterium]